MGGRSLEKTIGIIGGGQLGKMMILEARKMGFSVVILDPSADCPAHGLADRHIVAGFGDGAAINELAGLCDVITYEIEHINAEELIKLETMGREVYPTPQSLRLIQNKLTQKRTLAEAGLPVPDFMEISGMDGMELAAREYGFPFMLKACTGGYDGRGNARVDGPEGLEPAFQALGGGRIPLMAERFIGFSKEVSALACRGLDGSVAVYPIAENYHQDNILIETRVPADISADAARQAMELARAVMEVFGGVGMFCVEMFVAEDAVYLNEVAPRPHNSGHYTIEACVCSQFEQHVRAISGLPLGDTSLIRPAVMRNLLGEDGYEGSARVEGAAECLAISGVSLHIYGKTDTKPRRKMGHITALGETLGEAGERARRAGGAVRIISHASQPWQA